MKVAILLESFDPKKGYLEYYLARELAALGNNVEILTFERTREVFESEVDGIRVIRIPSLLSFHSYNLFTVRRASNVVKILKENPPEIAHSQPLFSPLSLFFMVFERPFDYKIVGSLITGEFSISQLAARFEYSFVRFLVNKYVNRKSKIVFALSNEVKNIVSDLFHVPLEKIQVVPLGADHDLFRFNLEARRRIRNLLNLSPDDEVIINTGRIIPSKRLDLLIKALASLKSMHIRSKLLFVGDGSPDYVESLKKLAETLGVRNRTVFHTAVHRTKLPEYYSASDIAVWPGSPSISIIEAMSTGLPVIVRESFVSNCELEYDNGFSFAAGDLNALAACLQKLISDQELRVVMGKRSRALVEDKLNWKKIARTYLDLYAKAQENEPHVRR